jgi:hypothetical protein
MKNELAYKLLSCFKRRTYNFLSLFQQKYCHTISSPLKRERIKVRVHY